MEGDAVTDTDIWNWISAFIQSFAETFLLVNVYCAFLGQPRIKKYVAYSLISCFAIAYCVFINVFTLPTYLRYSLSLCVFFASSTKALDSRLHESTKYNRGFA